ncbi:MAG: hypothetical protein AABZ60_02840 [Planctomycetota bacterium]
MWMCEKIQKIALISGHEIEDSSPFQEKWIEEHLLSCPHCHTFEEKEFFALETLLLESFASFRLSPVELTWLPDEIKKEDKRFQRLRRWKTELVAALVFWSLLFLNYESLISCFAPSSKSLEYKDLQASLNGIFPKIELSQTANDLKINQNSPFTLESSILSSSEQGKESSEIFFQKMKKSFESKRLRGDIIAVSHDNHYLTIDKGSVEYLEIGSEIVVYQKQFQTVARVLQTDRHQAICQIETPHPIEPGAHFFAMTKIPQLQPMLSAKIQGKIVWIEASQVGIAEVIGNEEMSVGDFFSVYREKQKIGVVLLSSLQEPIAHLIYQTVPFQKGDQVILEIQSKHFLTESL